MNLVIEVLRRTVHEADRNSPWFIAVVTEGETSHPAVGVGSTERVATLNALTKFHNQRDEAAKPPSLDLAPEAEVAAARTGLSRVVATDPAAISRLISRAIHYNTDLLISGRKVSGDSYAGRRIRPTGITCPIGDREYVKCYDPVAQEGRAFRLDGIERAELA